MDSRKEVRPVVQVKDLPELKLEDLWREVNLSPQLVYHLSVYKKDLLNTIVLTSVGFSEVFLLFSTLTDKDDALSPFGASHCLECEGGPNLIEPCHS